MKNVINLQMLMISSIFYSQIGINTQNPQGIFHVDGAGDNNVLGVPSTVQQFNDFVVTNSGNVGVGTITPSKKLEIISSNSPALRIDDGTQEAGYILMSDSNGNGSWKAATKAVLGNLPNTGYNGSVSAVNTWTGVSITLPPGKWLVLTNIILRANPVPSGGKGAWIRLQWSMAANTSNTAGITGPLNSGVYASPYGLALGSSIINNNSQANKVYYLNLSGADIFGGYSANWNNLGSASWTENSIIAYPAN
jgi:hypothetical protein